MTLHTRHGVGRAVSLKACSARSITHAMPVGLRRWLLALGTALLVGVVGAAVAASTFAHDPIAHERTHDDQCVVCALHAADVPAPAVIGAVVTAPARRVDAPVPIERAALAVVRTSHPARGPPAVHA